MNPSQLETRKIFLMYRRPLCKTEKVIQFVSNCGEFTHCEVYCPDLDEDGFVGWTFTNFSMCKMMKTRRCIPSYIAECDKYTFHSIDLTRNQFSRFVEWNRLQVLNKCSYNYKDLPLQMLPKTLARSTVNDLNTTQATTPKKLFCSQAVILALRHALEPTHRVSLALAHINTRLSTPTMVATSLESLYGKPRDVCILMKIISHGMTRHKIT
jgi:hypothetical protein